MHNDFLEKTIVSKESENKVRELFEKMIADKERELFENTMVIERPLSDFSTTQLKAELRRRKKERR